MEWQICSIGQCVTKTYNRDPRDQPDKPFTYIDVSSVDNSLFRITSSSVLQGRDAPSRARKVVHKGDVIFSTVRPTLRRVAFITGDFHNKICSTGYCVLRPNHTINGLFLFYWLLTDEVLREVDSVQRGANYPAIRDSDLKKLQIPTPALHEQRRIAAVLSLVQRAIEQQERLIVLSTELKKALMHKLFSEGTRGEPQKQTEIGPIPNSWKVVKIGNIAALKSGGTPSRKKEKYWIDGTIRWVKTGEVDYCVINDTEEKINFAGLENSSAKMFPRGTLIMAMYGQGITRGKVAILGVEAATNQACVAFFPDPSLKTRFLYHYFEYKYDEIRNLSHGANQKNLSADILKSYGIAFPSNLDEQNQIIEPLSILDFNIEVALRKKSAMQNLFRTLLHQLMTAEIRVNDLDLEEFGLDSEK